MANIGFIGLGNMGGPMARNLLKAGHTVKGFDLVPAALEAFGAAGGASVPSAVGTVEGADAIVTMLPAGKHVRSVYLGDDGLVTAVAKGTLLIDCSTIDVATAREVAAAAREAGMDMVDAPVSGGVGGAEAGTLTFMVGGEAGAFERARPLLEAMGRNIVHAGGAGNGQAAKICNNMMLGAEMIVTCEAFLLAERLGLSAEKLFEISSTASGQSWSLTSYCPVPGPLPTSPANRDYQPGFAAAMMLKDLLLAQEAAHSVAATTPLGEHAASLYQAFCESGSAGVDFSGIIKMLREKS